MRILALHRRGLGELRSEIRVRPELTEERFGQGLRVGRSLGIRQRDVSSAAFAVGAGKGDGLFGGEADGDEERRIIDIDLHRLAMRIDRLVERRVKWSVSTFLS